MASVNPFLFLDPSKQIEAVFVSAMLADVEQAARDAIANAGTEIWIRMCEYGVPDKSASWVELHYYGSRFGRIKLMRRVHKEAAYTIERSMALNNGRPDL